MSFDLNIQNYRPEDVISLFKLPVTYCDADVDEKADAIRTQLLTEDLPSNLKNEISLFLDAAREMVKRDWIPNAPGREELIARPAIPFVPSKNEEFTKGDFNPYAKRTMTKMVSIDTLFRINSSTTQSNDFSYVLPESIRNVVSMRLACIELPNTINIFSTLRKSNTFRIITYRRTQAEDYEEFEFTIPDGSYSKQDLSSIINQLLLNKQCDYVVFETSLQNTAIFRTRELSDGGRSPFIQDGTGSPEFRFELDFVVPDRLLSTTAGWTLGFRNATYTGIALYDDPLYGLSHNYIMSECALQSSIDNYLFLEVDDFHNNFQTDTIISTNATSYLGKNILARVVLNMTGNTNNNANDGMFKKREYLGPVRIEKLHFRLLNKFGDTIDLGLNDFSFALEFVTIYS